MKRLISACSPEHECSTEEINAIGDELTAVTKDPDIKRYDKPDVDEMKTIIAEAEAYTGEWYHSEVAVDEKLFISEEHTALRERIVELGADHGIFLYFSFEFNPKGTMFEPGVSERMRELFGSTINFLDEDTRAKVREEFGDSYNLPPISTEDATNLL